MNTAASRTTPDFDVVVVGAGMAGLYLLHRLRGLGMSAIAVETGDHDRRLRVRGEAEDARAVATAAEAVMVLHVQ